MEENRLITKNLDVELLEDKSNDSIVVFEISTPYECSEINMTNDELVKLSNFLIEVRKERGI